MGLLGSLPMGWAVSLMWEAASVWLWWRGDRARVYRLAKWGATLALVGGMIAQGAGPLLMQGDAGRQAAAVRETAKDTLEKLLVAVVDQERRGFKDTLDRLIAAALEKPAPNNPDAPARKSATAPPPEQVKFPPSWKPALAWVPVAVFPLLYGVALLALVTMATGRPGGQPDRRPPASAGRAKPRQGWFSRRPGNPAPDAPGTLPDAPAMAPDSPAVTPQASAMIEFGRCHGLNSKRAVANAINVSTSTFHDFLNGKAGEDTAAEIMEKLKR